MFTLRGIVMIKNLSYCLLIAVLLSMLSACSPVDSVSDTTYDMSMTLDDVRKLAAKGDDLLFEDLSQYKGANASSDLNSYIRRLGQNRYRAEKASVYAA